MKIQQIRNATLKIEYGRVTFLLDPWLQDKGTGFSASAIRPKRQGVSSPLNSLPFSPEKVLDGVDYCLVTHVHPDHFTKEYLPKDIKILSANENDRKKIQNLGFKNVSVVDEKFGDIGVADINIKKTRGVHGDNEEVALEMGESSGYLITGEKKSLYIAGDTVFNKDVAEILKKYKPDVIVLNCDEATTPKGRLIMNLSDVESVCKLCPDSTVILTHLDSVNHALLSSKDVREFVEKNKLKNAVVLKNGETINL